MKIVCVAVLLMVVAVIIPVLLRNRQQPALPPRVHYVPNQHGCPLAHWHYFVCHQAPWPLCINRLQRNFGGCIPPKPGHMPPPNE